MTQVTSSLSKKCSADTCPLYSDLTMWQIPSFVLSNSNFAISGILLMSFKGLNSLQEEDVRNKFSRACFKNNYQGKWNLVELLTRQENFTPANLLKIVLEKVGPHSFYGNYLRLMIRIDKNLKIKKLYLRDKRKVNKPQRKRGYSDHGTLRTGLSKDLQPTRPERKYLPINVTESFFFANTYLADNNNRYAAELVKDTTFLANKLTEEEVLEQKERQLVQEARKKARRKRKKHIKKFWKYSFYQKRVRKKNKLISRKETSGLKLRKTFFHSRSLWGSLL